MKGCLVVGNGGRSAAESPCDEATHFPSNLRVGLSPTLDTTNAVTVGACDHLQRENARGLQAADRVVVHPRLVHRPFTPFPYFLGCQLWLRWHKQNSIQAVLVNTGLVVCDLASSTSQKG